MDNKEFKKHLQELVHGHHHPEEHDWSAESNIKKTKDPVDSDRGKSPTRIVVRKTRRKAK